MAERGKRRKQHAVIKHAESTRKDFEIESWFFMVSNSEFCTESLSYIKYEMTYEDFAILVDDITFNNDLKRAAEEDNERENRTRESANRQQGR